MTPQEINIEIAKVCGWTLFEHECGLWSGLHNGTYIKYKCGISRDHAEKVCFPNYHGDLDAMHEAENKMTDVEWDIFCQMLGGSLRACASATAAKRAEAFLRTLNLWRNKASSCN